MRRHSVPMFHYIFGEHCTFCCIHCFIDWDSIGIVHFLGFSDIIKHIFHCPSY